MATSTLIQYLETERYASIPGDPSEAVGTDSLNRRQTETFLAASAVAAGDVVALDADQTADGDKAIKVHPADTGDTARVAVVGVALAAAAADEKVEVCVRGVCEATVLANAAEGNLLYITSTAGALDDVEGTAPAASSSPVAVCLETRGGSTGLTTVFVKKSF